jgi:hypothetical protein
MSNCKAVGTPMTPKSDFKKTPDNWKADQQDID